MLLSSDPGSSRRAHNNSSCNRGAVAPFKSASPWATRSAARTNSAGVNRADCTAIDAISSSGRSNKAARADSGT